MTTRKRLRCLWLLLRLPADGLDELLETLCEIGEFYTARRNDTPPSAPKPERVIGVLGETRVRDEFPIQLDDL